jgi:hypothetical protein
MDDPYGHDLGGDAYIESFLKAKHEMNRRYDLLLREPPVPDPNEPVGFDYVDMTDSTDGGRSRFTAYVEQPGKTNPKFSVDYFRVVLKKSPARPYATASPTTISLLLKTGHCGSPVVLSK